MRDLAQQKAQDHAIVGKNGIAKGSLLT